MKPAPNPTSIATDIAVRWECPDQFAKFDQLFPKVIAISRLKVAKAEAE